MATTEEDLLEAAEEPLDPNTQKFVTQLIDRILVFQSHLCDLPLFDYQQEISRRIHESMILGDGEEITALVSRQAGKSTTVASTFATAMVLYPKLAAMFPDLMGKFSKGLMVGIFAPVEEQATTLYGRIVDYLTSDRATTVLSDSEIDDVPQGSGKIIRLKRSGSFCRMHTANPRAKIESKSYHVVVIDEAQAVDDYVVQKSIRPMLAFYLGSIVQIGTPDRQKGQFYKAIQRNRRMTKGKKNHFQFDWRACARANPNYRKFVTKERDRLGEDSDEFQLNYEVRWLLERGMFVTESLMEELGDKTMNTVRSWTKTPIVVGIDPARKQDSTVVTAVWVDWDRPDEFGFYEHRVLNWLEIHGDDWESQYFQIYDFLSNYSLYAVGVDAAGVGDAVAGRLQVLLPGVEIVPLMSDAKSQSERWKHLMELMQRRMLGYPAHYNTRRTRNFKRFHQQMIDLEKNFQGPYMLAEAPKEAGAFDDYADSLALACMMTKDMTMPTIETMANPFFSR